MDVAGGDLGGGGPAEVNPHLILRQDLGQVGGPGVPQEVEVHSLVYPGLPGCVLEQGVEPLHRHEPPPLLGGEEGGARVLPLGVHGQPVLEVRDGLDESYPPHPGLPLHDDDRIRILKLIGAFSKRITRKSRLISPFPVFPRLSLPPFTSRLSPEKRIRVRELGLLIILFLRGGRWFEV